MTTNRFAAGDRVRIVGDAVEEFLGQTGTVLKEEDYPFEIVGDFPVYRVHMDDDDAKFYYWREDFLAAEDISSVLDRINERLDALEYAIWGDLDEVEEDLDAEAYGEEIEESLVARLEASIARLEDLNNYGQEA